MEENSPNIIGLASDHAGYDLKEKIKAALVDKKLQFMDLGTHSNDSVDYPDFGNLLGEKVSKNKVKYGIGICGSGIGISIALNRINGVSAALCLNEDMTKLARQHNNANVIVFGSRFIDIDKALILLDIFDNENFEGGRHISRVNKLG